MDCPASPGAALLVAARSRCGQAAPMEIQGVDPRDQRWECDSPTYRVYFHEGTTSDEYEAPEGLTTFMR